MDQTELPYQVRLASFEGPLDLLLHLIKKSEINIYDIPIALITQQYLDYLSLMKALNLAVAGEFLVMAATLVHIKSRMLLPDDGGAAEEDGPDPREELVQRLLEYKRYKDAAGQLNERERFWRELFPRGQAPEASVRPASDDPLAELTLFDLVDALQEVLARAPSPGLLEIEPETLTVKDRMNVILDRLEEKDSVTFLALFEEQATRLVIIVTFLALLELTRLRLIRVFQGENFGPILITRTFESVGADDPAEVEPLT